MSTIYCFVPNVSVVHLTISFSIIAENYRVNSTAFPMLKY